MPVKTINEFEDGSSTLSPDDLLLLLDSPNSSNQKTKYISVNNFSTLLNNNLENYGTTTGNYSKILGGDNNSITSDYSVIVNGRYNTISGNYNAIVGGFTNSTSSNNSFIGGGQQNTASGYYSSIVGGKNNDSESFGSSVGGGFLNSASAYGSNISGGQNNQINEFSYYSNINGGINNSTSGEYSAIIGGKNNTTSGAYASVIGGLSASATRHGQISHSSGSFSTLGSAQHSILMLRGISNSNNTIELTLDGDSKYLIINNGQILSGTINIVGTKTDGSIIARYMRQFTIKNVNNITSLVGSITSIGTDESNGTIINISANNTNKTLSIQVTGVYSHIWRWAAVVDCIELKYN